MFIIYIQTQQRKRKFINIYDDIYNYSTVYIIDFLLIPMAH